MSTISRRTLLKTSAALAASSAFSQALAAGANERIRVGVIGTRNRGWQNAETFQRSGRFEIATLCDCDSTSLDAAMGRIEKILPNQPALERDFRRILDDKRIDAVVVATPDHWHALMTVMALEAGKHVFVEKPASFNIDDGKAMVAAQKRHPKLVVAMGTQQRSGRHFKDAKAFIDSGGVGKIALARAWMAGNRVVVNKVPDSDPPRELDYDMWVGPAPVNPYNKEKVHYNWHFMRDYGTNDAGNWGGHYLDIVRWFADLDLPTTVSGFGGKYVVQDEKEWFDTQTAIFHYPNLTVIWEMSHWNAIGPFGMGTGAEIRGEKGTVLIDREGWTFRPENGEPVKHPPSDLEGSHVKNFADCITAGVRPAADIVEGHKTAVLCHLANIATLLNRTVRFDPKTETIQGDAEAAALQGREYRKKWTMPV